MRSNIKRAQHYLNQNPPAPGNAIKVLQPLMSRLNAPWPVFHLMGVALLQEDKHEAAAEALHKALEKGADQPETYHLLSVSYNNMGKFEDAENYGLEAVNRRSDFFKAWLNLGAVYRAQANLEEALNCYQKANQLNPRSAGVAFRIGAIYRDQGDLKKAKELFEITLKIDPEYYQALLEVADIHKKQQKFQEAEECLKRATEEFNDHLPIKVALAELYKDQGKFEKSIALYEGILAEYPEASGIRVNYALCLQALGKFDESEKNYEQALEEEPETHEALSNYLMGLHYNPERSKEEIYKAHLRWDELFAPEQRSVRPVPENKNVHKRLKIGFISDGFRSHPVGWMITKALENLSKDEVKVYCYTSNNFFDAITRRIHSSSDVWRSIVGYNDKVIANIIREDNLDILIDLSGHAGESRLKVIDMEPAPIIVKWVGGLFNTTGLQSVDYLISDRYETPPGEEQFFTEKLVRLPDDYISFLPPEYAPEVGPLPANENGYITFGCFNNPSKVNEVLLEQWAKIMNRVPESRLLLKSRQYETRSFTDRITHQMERYGIHRERLVFKGQTLHDQHLEAYNQVDIALDTWPYSGGLTTCEALWMGVPVVTNPGPTFAGRHSTTHLANAGFPGWIANSWEDYTDVAVSLAEGVAKLSELRSTLRQQMAQSPLCDGARFAAHLTKAFKKMWAQRVKGFESGAEEWQDHIEVDALPKEKNKKGTGDSDTGTIFDSSFIGEESSDRIKNKASDPEELKRDNLQTDEVAKNSKTSSTDVNSSATYRIETKDGITICTPADLNMLTPYVLLEQEQWYEPEIQFVRKFLKPGMKTIDIGAGFGVYALPMAKQVGKEGAVYAFEPGSMARGFLEKSKRVNKFENLNIIGSAVAAQAGKSFLSLAKTPEENKLDDNGHEEVANTTLDTWWKNEGCPNLDFIKLDINGMEAQALKGGGEVLKETAPVILVSIGEEVDQFNTLRKLIKESKYRLYEYLQGPQLLVEYDPEAGMDAYLQNMIAIPEERIDSLKSLGWIFDEKGQPQNPIAGVWEQRLSEMPWSKSLFEQWKKTRICGEYDEFLEVLDIIFTAEQIDVEKHTSARSQKGELLLKAAQRLIVLINKGEDDWQESRWGIRPAMTLARVMHQLGKQGQAAEIMNELMEVVNADGIPEPTLPFLLPLERQDQKEIKTDYQKWLMVQIVEAWIQIKDFTTYFSQSREQKMLTALEGNPEINVSLQKSSRLNGLKNDTAVETKHHIKSDLNTWFWKNSNHLNGKNVKSETEKTPSEVIKVKINTESAVGKDNYILIPKREIFRLRNIFNDHEYALPKGFPIKDVEVIVDVGANVGAFALYAKQWNRQASIYCYEPNSQVYPLLEQNTCGLQNVHKSFTALGDSDGEIMLFQHPRNTGQSTTSHRISGAKAKKVKVQQAGNALKEKEIKRIDVLKIDTEGAEVSILKGLKEYLSATKIVMLEYHTEEDRREIDELLNEFHLYSSVAQGLSGIGTVKYVNKNIMRDRL